jgi:hypothetical protein
MQEKCNTIVVILFDLSIGDLDNEMCRHPWSRGRPKRRCLLDRPRGEVWDLMFPALGRESCQQADCFPLASFGIEFEDACHPLEHVEDYRCVSTGERN